MKELGLRLGANAVPPGLSISEQREQFLPGLGSAEIPHLENLFYRQPNALQVL